MKISHFDIYTMTRLYRAALLFCLILSPSAFCESSKDRLSQACVKQSIESVAPIGASYNYVIEQYGKPKTKQEQETARTDVWIYSGGAIEFKNGRVSKVLCKKPNENGSQGLVRPKSIAAQNNSMLKPQSEYRSSYNSGAVDSKGYSDALNELTKVSPNAESGAASAGGSVVSGAPVIPQMRGLR
jgi:hypothetical protein